MSKFNLVINNEIPIKKVGECKPGTVVQLLPTSLYKEKDSICRIELEKLHSNYLKAIIVRDVSGCNNVYPLVFKDVDGKTILEERDFSRNTKCVVINLNGATFSV